MSYFLLYSKSAMSQSRGLFASPYAAQASDEQ